MTVQLQARGKVVAVKHQRTKEVQAKRPGTKVKKVNLRVEPNHQIPRYAYFPGILKDKAKTIN